MKSQEVHISTRTIIRFWIVVLVLGLLAFAVYQASWSIIMVAVAFFLALVLNRPVDFFARKLPGNSRALGAAVTFIITLAVVGGAITLILPVLAEQTTNFAKSLPDTFATLQDQFKGLENFVNENGVKETYDSSVTKLVEQVNEIGSNLGAISVSILSNIITGIGNAFILLVITFFMLVEGPHWVEKFWEIAFKDKKKRAKYHAISNKMYHVVTGYVSSMLISAAITSVLAGIGVFILSLIFPVSSSIILPITAIVFVSTFIPFFGGFIGAAISSLLVLLFNPIAAIIFILYNIIYLTIFYNIFQPKIAGRLMRISALLVLLSLIVGMQMGGIFGALVAIPVAGCLVVLFREHLKFRDTE